MTLTEIYPTIEALPRAEKLKLIQWLAADVAKEDETVQSLANTTVEYWSPYDSLEGASVLYQFLQDRRGEN